MLTDKDSGLLNAQTELPEAKKNLHIPEDFDCLNEKKKVGMLPLSCNELHLRIGKRMITDESNFLSHPHNACCRLEGEARCGC